MRRSARTGVSVVNHLALALISLASAGAQTTPDEILLKDYKPHSIFQIPETRIERARYSAIDVHSHNYARTDPDIDRWVKTMDDVGLEKTVILSGQVGTNFDQTFARYHKHPERFEVWCGIDYTGLNEGGYGPAAVAELERCHRAGATGVGELSDKGRGLGGTTNHAGMHIDDPRMDSILNKCAELHMPVNIHVGEDKWMYEPMDATNDGLMNAWKWRVPNEPSVLQHDEVVATLERAVAKHPHTVFIACHFANCCSDLKRLGAMLDKYPNLYADMGARFAEIAPIPRFMRSFFQRYQDRLLYGTDMDPNPGMFRVSFRLLETEDEHFYPEYFSKYHWAWYGFGLPDSVLKKIYRDNARRILAGAQ
ncbi:MAG TPA: amidohydrolase family protein [Verrucomicrobiae bacterium]|nr:amidohydrolase family protein [Verrucomicrobiae bacterium]